MKTILITLVLIILIAFTVKAQKTVANDTTIYNTVDQEPEFPGGDAAFAKYFITNLKVPASPNENIKSRLEIEFIVEKDGSLTNIKIIKSISSASDQSVVEELKQSPKWNPGKLHNKPVRVRYKIPMYVDFQQDDQ